MISKRLSFLAGVVNPTRYYRTRSKFNPGLDKRLKLFKNDFPGDNNKEINDTSLDEFEEDISNMKHLSDVHASEIKKARSRILFKQVERKYFDKQKLPNMLLWEEKEQIRQLFNSEPDVWTPEKLSTCFPATTLIIRKILNSRWKPANQERIIAHDKAVRENWQALEMGKLNLPDCFAKHIKSFTSRKTEVIKPVVKLPEIKEQKHGEFSNIIRNYKDIRETLNKSEEVGIVPPLKSLDEDSFMLANKNSKSFFKRKEYTLAEMKKMYKNEMEKTSEEPISNKDSTQNYNLTQGLLNKENSSKSQNLENSNIIEITDKQAYKLNIGEKIVMEIKIPKEKWKKGCIYKLNNCYYSDDGELLYRV